MSLARSFLLAMMALVLSFGTAMASAHAQGFAGSGGTPNIRATLEVEGPVTPGGQTMLAIRFVPVSEEWHGYWSNPGDAGLGMQVEWDLPDGVSVGAFEYPVPSRLTIDGLMNHVYKGEYAVLAPLRLAENAAVGGPFRISGKAFYLACTDQICVPEEARIEAAVTIANGGVRDPRFAEYRAAIPPLLDKKARFEQSRGLLRIAIPLPSGVDAGQPHLFLEQKDVVQYAARQGFSQGGDELIAEIPLAGSGEEPRTLSGILKLAAGTDEERGLRFEAVRGDVPSGGRVLVGREPALPSAWLVLLGAFAGGLLLNVMPCVFPVLSLKAMSLARAGIDQPTARRDGLAYTAGVMLTTTALGGVMLALRAAGEQVGWAFQLQEPGVVVALLVLATLITANFAGLFELPSRPIASGGKPAGAFATGLLAAVVATPCTGPFMAAAIGAALLLPTWLALAIFASLGLGLALPFLLLGFVPALRNRLPKPGKWMDTFRKILAIPMGLTVLALGWLLTQLGGISLLLLGGLAALAAISLAFFLHRRRLPVAAWAAGLGLVFAVGAARAGPVADAHDAAQSASLLDPQPFSEAALADARATGRPVFVWFTADWCVTCKLNERVGIEREETRQAFERAGVISLRGDWTRRDDEIAEFLTRQGAAGVPLYLWYPAGGTAEPRSLPQVLTPGTLPDLARSVTTPVR